MQYLLDTVTIVRHFSQHGEIGEAAARILDPSDENEDLFVVSVISLMEVMYLAERNRIQVNLDDTLAKIEASANYAIIDLNADILRTTTTVDFPELHDRLILATAKWLDIPVLSSDRAFGNVDDVKVIWD